MEILAISALVVGTIGVSLSRKNHWDHSAFTQYKIYSTLATALSIGGWIMSIVVFGWKGLLFIAASMIVGVVISGNRS